MEAEKTIVGFIRQSFTPKGSEKTISGIKIFYTEPLGDTGVGMRADGVFLSNQKLERINIEFEVGQKVEFVYNRYGSVDNLNLIKNDDIIIE